MLKIFLFIFMSLTLLGLMACTSKNLIPRDLPDMRTIYDAHVGGANYPNGAGQAALNTARQYAQPPLYQADGHLEGYTRTAYNEVENLFPRLPNPTLIMYIDPHLTDQGHPVPGYSTAFSLYEKPQWALPGEVPPAHQPVSTGQ